MEYRRKIEARDVAMISEISGYHYKGEYDKSHIQSLAQSSMKMGADEVEIMAPDFASNERLVKDIKELGDIPVVLGGGTTVENCKERLRYADAALVGSCFEGGNWGGDIIESIVADYMKEIRALEAE